MKNFQQTPKQRRLKLEKDKRELRHSNPKRQFHQEHLATNSYWYGDRIKNLISIRGHKL